MKKFLALALALVMGKLFTNNQYVTIAIPLSVLVAIGVWIVLGKTKFGYELRATGCNKDAARYCGMAFNCSPCWGWVSHTPFTVRCSPGARQGMHPTTVWSSPSSVTSRRTV